MKILVCHPLTPFNNFPGPPPYFRRNYISLAWHAKPTRVWLLPSSEVVSLHIAPSSSHPWSFLDGSQSSGCFLSAQSTISPSHPAFLADATWPQDSSNVTFSRKGLAVWRSLSSVLPEHPGPTSAITLAVLPGRCGLAVCLSSWREDTAISPFVFQEPATVRVPRKHR